MFRFHGPGDLALGAYLTEIHVFPNSQLWSGLSLESPMPISRLTGHDQSIRGCRGTKPMANGLTEAAAIPSLERRAANGSPSNVSQEVETDPSGLHVNWL